MKDFKISIVTSSLNQGIYVKDAIQSLLQQNFEYLVINEKKI